MMNAEYLANFIEVRIQSNLEHFNNSEVMKFTPSIQEGRRYIGFKQGGKSFLIEINVEEATEEQSTIVDRFKMEN